jgi:PDZ domain
VFRIVMSRAPRWISAAVLLALAAVPAPAADPGAAGSGPDDVVKLAPVRVEDYSIFLGYSISIHLNRADQTIQAVKFTKIEPGSLADKAGLRVRDSLLAIDGSPIAGHPKEEFVKLMRKRAEPGHPAVYAFSIARGFFKQERLTLNLTVKSSSGTWVGLRPLDEMAPLPAPDQISPGAVRNGAGP